jgi:hypothetical protein
MAGEVISAELSDQVKDDRGEIAVFRRQSQAHDLGFLDDVMIDKDSG